MLADDSARCSRSLSSAAAGFVVRVAANGGALMRGSRRKRTQDTQQHALPIPTDWAVVRHERLRRIRASGCAEVRCPMRKPAARLVPRGFRWLVYAEVDLVCRRRSACVPSCRIVEVAALPAAVRVAFRIARQRGSGGGALAAGGRRRHRRVPFRIRCRSPSGERRLRN